ncbi:MAG: 16S rRNA (cytosine(1402)-N(4))-methyltransferase RsmH [Gammaproteobacteria bacterium]|nr:16S rRNA (cytosine(1402)-N(4))-methyltransferase RsmH [Gammaproteobacteria bacterium]
MSDFEHKPVLLQEAVDGLSIKPSGIYLDGTFGRGGHSAEIFKHLNEEGRLLATDRDPEAVATAIDRFGGDSRFTIVRANFTDLYNECEKRGWLGKVDGILLDLGVSSPQLDDSERGFSMRENGPLDMRMDPDSGMSAAEWLEKAKANEIAGVLKKYGEERFAKRIAGAIVAHRDEHGPFTDTATLSKVISEANPKWERERHPATRSFQAIRIEINAELKAIELFLESVLELLAPGGRLVVISFHSLEDRRIKRFMRDLARGDDFPPDLPITADQIQPTMKLIGRAVRASKEELERNPRARSAVMRVAERMTAKVT